MQVFLPRSMVKYKEIGYAVYTLVLFWYAKRLKSAKLMKWSHFIGK